MRRPNRLGPVGGVLSVYFTPIWSLPFPPRTHFTASEGQDDLSAARQRKSATDCPIRRTAAWSVTLPQGTPVKTNKVIGGAPGYGELRVERSLSPDSIRSGTVLSSGHKLPPATGAGGL